MLSKPMPVDSPIVPPAMDKTNSIITSSFLELTFSKLSLTRKLAKGSCCQTQRSSGPTSFRTSSYRCLPSPDSWAISLTNFFSGSHCLRAELGRGQGDKVGPHIAGYQDIGQSHSSSKSGQLASMCSQASSAQASSVQARLMARRSFRI